MLVVVVLVVVDDVPGGGGGGKCYCFAADVVRLAPWSLWVPCVAGPGRCVAKPFPCGCWTRAVCDKAETVISRLHMGEGRPVRTPCEKLLTVGHKIS